MNSELLTDQLFILSTRLELVSTLILTGLIWTIQIVHYPLLLKVGAQSFLEYERSHCNRITWIVAPLMFTEAFSCGLNVAHAGWSQLAISRVALLGVIWLSTAFIQVPLHKRLAGGFDSSAIEKLVATNWIRTFAWSARAGLLAFGYGG